MTLRGTFSFALRLGLVVACLAYALWDLDMERILAVIGSLRAWSLIAALFLGISLYLLQGLRFRAITGFRLSPARALLATVFGIGLNNILPARLGELGKCLYLRRHADFPIRLSLGFIFWERFADLNMILLLTWGASFVARSSFAWLPLAALVAGLWLGVAAVLLLPRCRALLPRLLPFPAYRPIFADMIERFAAASSAGVLFRLALYSLLTWAALLGVFAFDGAVVVGMPLGLASLLVAFVVSSLGMAVPSSPGGLGVFEAAMVFSLGWYGIGRESALALALIVRLSQNLPAILISVLLLGKENLGLAGLREAVARLRAEAAGSGDSPGEDPSTPRPL